MEVRVIMTNKSVSDMLEFINGKKLEFYLPLDTKENWDHIYKYFDIKHYMRNGRSWVINPMQLIETCEQKGYDFVVVTGILKGWSKFSVIGFIRILCTDYTNKSNWEYLVNPSTLDYTMLYVPGFSIRNNQEENPIKYTTVKYRVVGHSYVDEVNRQRKLTIQRIVDNLENIGYTEDEINMLRDVINTTVSSIVWNIRKR